MVSSAHLSSSEVRNGEQTTGRLKASSALFFELYGSNEEPLLPEWLHLANSSALR